MNRTDVYGNFGILLKSCRDRVGMTQQELAEKSNFSRTSISNIESGKQRVLLHQIYEFADILNVPPHALMPFINDNGAYTVGAGVGLENLPEQDQEIVRHFLRAV